MLLNKACFFFVCFVLYKCCLDCDSACLFLAYCFQLVVIHGFHFLFLQVVCLVSLQEWEALQCNSCSANVIITSIVTFHLHWVEHHLTSTFHHLCIVIFILLFVIPFFGNIFVFANRTVFCP